MEYALMIWYVVLALLGFGFVIFIHELGHFLFAKWAGVQVDRFSIGFGPVLLKKQIGETEYALSLLPLGGYVKMLGQEDTPTAVTEEAKLNPKSYLAKNRGWQALILIGGVLFNLVSSYILLICLAWYGLPMMPPVVGDITPEIPNAAGVMQPSPAAQLGLHQGDRITSINGVKVRGFEDVMMGVISAGKQSVTMTVQRGDQQLTLPAAGTTVTPVYNPELGFAVLGVERPKGWRLLDVARVDETKRPEDPKPFERIIALDGKPLPSGMTGQQLEDQLCANFGRPVSVTLEHKGSTRDTTLIYAGGEHPSLLTLGRPVRIEGLTPGSPAAIAGLQSGDVIESIDGVPIAGRAHFFATTRTANAAGKAMAITVRRSDQALTFTVQGTNQQGRRMIGASFDEVTGTLPFLPRLPDGKPGPLETAGLKVGDTIVGDTVHHDGSHQLRVISGATSSLLPLTGLPPVPQRPAPGVFAVLSKLLNVQVDSTGEGHGFPAANQISVRTIDGHLKVIDLSSLPAETKTTLLTALKPGDRIVDLSVTSDGQRALEIARGGSEPRKVAIPARDVGVALMLGPETEPYRLSNWTEAFTLANDTAIQMVDSTLSFIPRFFKKGEDGGINPNKALTGPIGIFDLLRKSVELEGYAYFLRWIALIGLNLFLINLLPIPITDGGQLVMLGIETVIRRPLPDLIRTVFMWIGLILVGALMLYVIGLDVLRKLGLM